MKLKKFLILILTVVVILAGFTACESEPEVDTEALAPFLGSWDCQDTPLEMKELGETANYTGYLQLNVEEDGWFNLYDAEAGNPGICGFFSFPEEGKVLLSCDENEDFDPPFIWMLMEMEQVMQYTFSEDGKELQIAFVDEAGKSATLIFDKVEE